MKRRTLFHIITFCISILFIQNILFAQTLPQGDGPKAKYVFLFIGDGMGLAQVNLTQGYLSALDGKIGLKPLTFTTFPEIGLVSTFANNRLTTCSAAAGTALATGNKTNINRISMDPKGESDFKSIATKAKENGFKVGILTTVSIDHATPSVFYAHQPDRNNYFQIGMELAQSNFDYFAGGAFMKNVDTIEGKIINLEKLTADSGYTVVKTRAAFDKLAAGAGKTIVFSPRLSIESSMPFYLDMNPNDLTLGDYTAKAINLLTNDKGFFMMIEGGKIDWACHSNDAAAEIQEVIEFDKAVENAYSFYMKHPDETLIIVTADHETGALGLGNEKTKYDTYLDKFKYQKSSVEELSQIVAQLRANKSGDADFDFNRMMKILETEVGINSRINNTLLNKEDSASFKKIFMESVYSSESKKGTYGDKEPMIDEAVRMLAEKAGISWGSGAHSFIDVPVYAIGVGSEKFTGIIDNTDIPKRIAEIMEIKTQ
jgi:alkaline phosphatase